LGGEVSARQVEQLVEELILLANISGADAAPAPSVSWASSPIPQSFGAA